MSCRSTCTSQLVVLPKHLYSTDCHVLVQPQRLINLLCLALAVACLYASFAACIVCAVSEPCNMYVILKQGACLTYMVWKHSFVTDCDTHVCACSHMASIGKSDPLPYVRSFQVDNFPVLKVQFWPNKQHGMQAAIITSHGCWVVHLVSDASQEPSKLCELSSCHPFGAAGLGQYTERY